jgi:HEAT repeat protein
MSKSRVYSILIVALLLACAAPTLAQTVAPKQDEPKLIAVLQNASASQKDKIDACRQLAIIGGKDSIAPLAALLGDEKLSHNARYALERNPDPAVDEALRSAMDKVKGQPLVGVITSVGVRRDTKAVPAMAKLLNESDAMVARAAARAMGSIGTSEAADALQKALPNASADRKLDVCEGLFRCAERFTAEEQKDKAIAIYDQLRALDGAHQVRAGALRGAILARGRDGLALLQENLRSKDYILFSAAVQTSQVMPGGAVTKALLDALKDLPADNQIVVIQAVSLRNDKQALPVLLAAAQAGPTPVRIAAIEAVTEMGNASAVPVLVQLLNDADKEISAAAKENLAALPGKEADAAVLDMFNSGNAEKRLLALDLIGQRRMVSSMPALLKAARDDDPRVRQAATKVAGDMAGADQVSSLLDLLTQSDKPEDLAAAEQALMTACTKTGDSQAMAGKVIAALDKAKPPQKAVLLRVLAAVGGPEALKAVQASLGSSDADVRAAAIRAMSAWKTLDAAPQLLALAKDAKDPGERTLFLRGYLSMAGRRDAPVEDRLAMAKQAVGVVQGESEKMALLGALGSITSTEALPLITPYLDDPATRSAAVSAVLGIAERLLRDQGNQKYGPVLAESLEKAMQSTSEYNAKTRIKTLLEKAKSQGQ